jgi:hypothetical protein
MNVMCVKLAVTIGRAPLTLLLVSSMRGKLPHRRHVATSPTNTHDTGYGRRSDVEYLAQAVSLGSHRPTAARSPPTGQAPSLPVEYSRGSTPTCPLPHGTGPSAHPPSSASEHPKTLTHLKNWCLGHRGSAPPSPTLILLSSVQCSPTSLMSASAMGLHSYPYLRPNLCPCPHPPPLFDP